MSDIYHGLSFPKPKLVERLTKKIPLYLQLPNLTVQLINLSLTVRFFFILSFARFNQGARFFKHLTFPAIVHRWMDLLLTRYLSDCFYSLNGFYRHLCLKVGTALFPFFRHEQLLLIRVVQSLTPCPVFGGHYTQSLVAIDLVSR
ncbi:MAG: hypothetical protein VKL39_16250 [Leptolyngbyaceae bacterium]|nr:hypothetical protein [Leptolyngbyaceae bacterium]